MTTTTVTRTATNSTRFGRSITYRTEVDGVVFYAERMVGVSDDYSVYSYQRTPDGRLVCGMSFHHARTADTAVTVPGGRNVAARFATLAADLRRDPATYTNPSHDPTTCGVCAGR